MSRRGQLLVRRAGRLALLAVVVAALASCRVEGEVALDVGRTGAGTVTVTVTLDQAATQRLGDPSAELRTDDLESAGWRVDPPQPTPEGGLVLRASKPFTSPQEAASVLQQVAGPDVIRDVSLTHDSSLVASATSFDAVVDLAPGLAVFGDDRLTEQLGGQPFGLDPAQLEQQLGGPPQEVVKLVLAVDLPGDMTANSPERDGDTAVWRPRLGEVVEVDADSRRIARERVLVLVVAALAVLAAATAVTLRLARRGGRGLTVD